MPQINTDSGARAAQPKKVKAPAKKAAAKVRKPSSTKIAAQQEQQYQSQAHAVRVQGNRQKRVMGKSPSGDRPQNRAREMTSPQVQQGVKQARVRVLTKRKAGSGTRQIKAELEGKGVLAKVGAKIGDTAAQHIRAKGIGNTVVPRTSTASLLPTRLASGLAKDVANLPSAAVPSVYVPAAGVVEAAKGKPQRLKQFVKDVKATDPIYNTAAAGVEAVKGNTKAAKAHLQTAKKSVVEHPGFAAAELFGGRGAVGRGAGRAVRGTAKVTGSETLKKVGTTERQPKVLPGTTLQEKQSYSPDLITKGRQVLEERNKRGRANRARQQAAAEPNPEQRAVLEAKARRLDPNIIRERDIAKRVDEHVAAVELVRRQHRGKVVSNVRTTLKPAGKAGPVTNLVAQRIARADVGDLKAYVAELAAEHPTLGKSAQRANEQLRHDISHAVKRAEKGKLDLAQVKTAADEYARVSQAGQTGLVKRGMLDAGQAERASLMPYAVRKMGAKHNGDQLILARKVVRVQNGKRVTTTQDTPLSNAAIRAHMRQNGEQPPAFISQAPNARGAKNFYVNSGQPPKATGASRTGEATRKGTFSAHPDTLTEQAARTQGLTDAFDHFQGFVKEFGYRDPKGRGGIKTKRTKKDADNLARNLSVGDTRWQAVRINPFGASKQQLAAMLEGTHDPKPLHDAIDAALKGQEGDGPWAIVPEAAARRMQEHTRLQSPGNAGRVARKASSAFRQTVLSTSPKWLVNNAAEAGFRSAFARAGVRSYVTGRKVLKRADQADTAAGEMLRARTVGGGHYAMADRQQIHTNIEAFTDGAIKDVAKTLSAAWKAPGPKHVASLWHGYTHFVFNVVNHYVEQQFQTAMLGKAVRDQLMPDQLVKLSTKALDDAAKGAVDTNTAVALGRAVDRMYGRYGKFSPSERQMIALYTPFIAWAYNAAYFVTRVLPQDHPAAVAVIAATVRATDAWRKEHGLDQFISGRVPGFLQGSIPGGGDVKYRAPGNTLPFGLFSDPLNSAASAVLPQLSTVLSAFEGRDWKGKELRDKNGQPLDEFGRAKVAAGGLLSSTIPVLAMANQIKKGPKGQLNSLTGRTAPKAATSASAPAPPSSSTKVRLGTGPSGVKVRLGSAPSGVKIRLGR